MFDSLVFLSTVFETVVLTSFSTLLLETVLFTTLVISADVSPVFFFFPVIFDAITQPDTSSF